MNARVLVCDDEAGLREMLRVLLRRAGHDVEVVDGVRAAIARLGEEPGFDAVITDLVMPDGSGMEVLSRARAREETPEVLMITAYATTEQAVEAMRRGAYDYVQKPFKNSELLATLEKALEKRAIVSENRTLRREVEGSFRFGDVVAKSETMRRVVELAVRAASARTSVLITGESGTGKEMFARALHFESDRRDRPFVVLNCGALPENLIESELFGHEKGAFTGATTTKEGLFRVADGGTIFLDEVGELALTLQVKLLRVLQDRKVRPVGGEREVPVDVRVIAATNRPLEQEVQENRFRQDLFYRLNVIRIHLPPLRHRPEDVPLLARHLLAKHAVLQGKRASFSPEALQWLARQTYPGNVRELENLIERAVALAASEEIQRRDFPEDDPALAPVTSKAFPAAGIDLDAYLSDIERQLILQALEQAGGVRTKAAKLLGTTFRSLRYRLAKYGIGEEDDVPAPPGAERDPSA